MALLLIASGSTTPAFAQGGGIHPDCRRMGDPRACTCALNNGGRLVPDNHRPGRMNWRSPRLGTGAHMAFMNCTNGSR
jgi:hypothetical protein